MSQQPLTDLARQAAELRLQGAEETVEAAVLTAMARWLETVRFLIIREASSLIGANPARAVDVASGAATEWRRAVDELIMPAVEAAYTSADDDVPVTAAGPEIAFGDDFRDQQRRDPAGTYRPESEYMQTVHDRFKIWPEGAFEDVRPELVEALAEAESVDDITARVGRTLGIDKDSRAIKADINAVEDRLMNDDTLDPQTRKELVAERRRLWKEHDAELSQWQWKARRIARTEAHGAVNSGQIDRARQRAADTGERLWKRWLGTNDNRTRASHRVADGQIVGLDEKFVVGGAELDFPGEAGGPAHEVIQCRCSMRIEDEVTLQEQLQGPDGSMGEVRPGGVRLGPDDPARVSDALSNADGISRIASRGQLVPGQQVSAPRGRIPGSSTPEVQSIDDLRPWTAPQDDPDKHFSPKEKAVADWLREAGASTVVSVDRSDHKRHPDSIAEFQTSRGAVEFKILEAPTAVAVTRGIRSGRGQARIVVIDGTRSGLKRADAETGLRAAISRYGYDLDQVIIRLDDGGVLVWTP